MLTTSQAAALVGLPKEQFRSAMSKERKSGKEFHVPKEHWLDARTPLWDEEKVLAWAKSRKKRKKRDKDAEHKPSDHKKDPPTAEGDSAGDPTTDASRE